MAGVCKASFYMAFFIYFVLSKIMLFIAIRYAGPNILRVLVVDFIFSLIMLFDIPWIFHLVSSSCDA